MVLNMSYGIVEKAESQRLVLYRNSECCDLNSDPQSIHQCGTSHHTRVFSCRPLQVTSLSGLHSDLERTHSVMVFS